MNKSTPIISALLALILVTIVGTAIYLKPDGLLQGGFQTANPKADVASSTAYSVGPDLAVTIVQARSGITSLFFSNQCPEAVYLSFGEVSVVGTGQFINASTTDKLTYDTNWTGSISATMRASSTACLLVTEISQ